MAFCNGWAWVLRGKCWGFAGVWLGVSGAGLGLGCFGGSVWGFAVVWLGGGCRDEAAILLGWVEVLLEGRIAVATSLKRVFSGQDVCC